MFTFKLPFAMKSAARGGLQEAAVEGVGITFRCGVARSAFGSGGLELPQSMRGRCGWRRGLCAHWLRRMQASTSRLTVISGVSFAEIEMAVTPDNIRRSWRSR